MTLRLVADVGGTNTRIALSVAGVLREGSVRHVVNDSVSGFDEIVQSYRAAVPDDVSEMVIAVAGPVRGTAARLTNRNWAFETATLARATGVQNVSLLNDLAALGHAAPYLAADDLRVIAPGTGTPPAPRQSLVVGLGTGFNVSPVLETPGGVHCPVAEAGHISLPAQVRDALIDAGVDAQPFDTVETLFSGRGFARFCAAHMGVAQADGATVIAAFDTDTRARQAVEAYSGLLGWLLRDLTLSYMALSGLYIAGSVGRAVTRAAPAPCAQVLHRPCPIRADTTPPLLGIEEDSAALTGCARYAGQ